MSNTWLQAFGETLKLPGLLVEVYKDLGQPGVQQVGKAIQTVLGLGNTVLWPIALANERSRIALEANLERYRHKLATVPVDEIVEVAPEIGVPIAEKLSYVSDDYLADLYVSLLATASTSRTFQLAHPSFVNVLNNFAPDEARLLQGFGGPEVVVAAIAPSWSCSTANDTFHFSNTMVYLDPKYTKDLQFKKSLPAYLANLEGLGLLEVVADGMLSSPVGVYDELEAIWKTRFETEAPLPERVLRIKRGHISSTPLGEQFWAACHSIGGN